MGVYNEHIISMKPLTRLLYFIGASVVLAGSFILFKNADTYPKMAFIILIGGFFGVLFLWEALSSDYIKIDDSGIFISADNKMHFWKDIQYAYLEKVKSGKRSSEYLTIKGTEEASYNVDELNIDSAKLRKIVKECTDKNIGHIAYLRKDEEMKRQAIGKGLTYEEEKEENEKAGRLLELFLTLSEKEDSKFFPTLAIGTALCVIATFYFISQDNRMMTGPSTIMPLVIMLTIYQTYKCILEKNFYNLPQIKSLDKKQLEMYEKMVFDNKKNLVLNMALAIIGAIISLIYIIFCIIA
ncbi:MAG: hypothetical protein MJZ23_05615 [Paludibacteraceae bacterium]|nr:hypothetical protein [Paludibacteraceae bacterium]